MSDDTRRLHARVEKIEHPRDEVALEVLALGFAQAGGGEHLFDDALAFRDQRLVRQERRHDAGDRGDHDAARREYPVELLERRPIVRRFWSRQIDRSWSKTMMIR